MSFSKTTLAFNKTSVRRPSPDPPQTLLPTPTSVVPAILSCPPGVDALSGSNSSTILALSNRVCGASDRRDMSLDVTSTVNANSRRSARRSIVSIPPSATLFINSAERRTDENDPVIQRALARYFTIEAESGEGRER